MIINELELLKETREAEKLTDQLFYRAMDLWDAITDNPQNVSCFKNKIKNQIEKVKNTLAIIEDEIEKI